jgi:hypothetical protein
MYDAIADPYCYAEEELPKPYNTVLNGYRVRVSFIAPVSKEAVAECELARARIEQAAAQCPPDPPVTMVRGYRVHVHYAPCPPEEAKWRRESVLRVLCDSIMEKRKAR